MRPKRWKALTRQVQSLGLDLEDHQELIRENTRDFETAVRRALGLETPDAVPGDFDASQAGLVPAGASSTPDPSVDGATPGGANSGPKGFDSEEFQAVGDDGPAPESMRRLWRAIASATHPDRTGGDPELDAAYKKAAEAWTKREFETLLDVAMELGLTLPEPDEALEAAMIRRAEGVTKALRNIEATAMWAWIDCDDPKRKAEIIRQVAEHVRKTKK